MANHKKDSFWARKFHPLRARIGPNAALIAIARKMLVAIHHMLGEHVPYKELGAACVPTNHPERCVQRLVRQLEGLGFSVTMTPLAPQLPVIA
ncbi:MAG: hypothetical protein WCJ30_28940 [Deltaproteobacteria bacterium]